MLLVLLQNTFWVGFLRGNFVIFRLKMLNFKDCPLEIQINFFKWFCEGKISWITSPHLG